MSKQGGDLNDWAKDGTSVPGDAGKQNTIPSVPNPHQKNPAAAGGLGAPGLDQAADNGLPADVDPSRAGGVGEGVSATGHDLPASTISKPGGRGGK